jgi:hypothetical protein
MGLPLPLLLLLLLLLMMMMMMMMMMLALNHAAMQQLCAMHLLLQWKTSDE